MAELNSIPEDLTNSFEFTTDDYERIILKDSLFDETETGLATNTDLFVRSLKKLTIRETKQYLHAVTLSDYFRKKIIPRGLRIQKLSPASGLNGPMFLDRWCEILNKCSLDLMTLVIQETSDQLAKTKDEIKDLTDKLDNELKEDKRKLEEIKKELEQLKEKCHNEIIVTKREKFQRDTRDYASGNIYFWRNRDSTQPKTHRGAKTHAPSASWLSSTSADSDSSEQSGRGRGAPFLGNNRGDTYTQRTLQLQPPRGRARGRPRKSPHHTTNGRGEGYARGQRSSSRNRQQL